MSSRDRHDDELEERLDELEDVLSELRRDLRETDRDRRGPPRPPTLSELLRFTEQYTIPTVIALLETTIKSLELLRGTLRLADPGRNVAAGAAGDRLADVRDGASAGLARSLSELRTALSEADLPEEAASRSIIGDARDLTAEIESRIEEGRREADAARRSDRRAGTRKDDAAESADGSRPDRGRANGDRGVRIDVTDPDAASEPDAASDDAGDDPAPEVDVESELESIKRQIDGDESDVYDAEDAETNEDAEANEDAENTENTENTESAESAEDGVTDTGEDGSVDDDAADGDAADRDAD